MKKVYTLILITATMLTACGSLTTQQKQILPDDISQAKNDSERYLLTYYPIAVEQMKKHGIPASITLAQGLLESGRGKSRLATEGKNHFGIKADDRWEGDTIMSFDNGRWCSFRVYRNIKQSYEDHSKFLIENSRYDFLFELDPKDYKGWARGLKRAYYAEDREYDSKLISIIERYGLYQYDRSTKSHRKQQKKSVAVQSTPKEILKANGLLYVIADDGDTFKSLSKELGISKRKIRKYNDLYKGYTFNKGDIVYLQKKHNKARRGYDFHTTLHGESLYRIAQVYGIKLKSLYKLNPQYKSYTKLKVGDVVRLR